jgi:hypothetical protein
MNYTYFPVSATLSIHHDGIDNVLGGIAMVGKEGMAGVSFNLMTTPAIPCKAIVQIAGRCFRLSSDALLNSFKRSTDVMLIILRYTQAFLSQMAQTALCNWSHPVDQRLARWLLVSNNEAVKKPDSHKPAQRLSHRPASSSGFEGSCLQFAANLRDGGTTGAFYIPLLRIPAFCQLLNVVHHAVQVPLRIDLLAPSVVKAG